MYIGLLLDDVEDEHTTAAKGGLDENEGQFDADNSRGGISFERN